MHSSVRGVSGGRPPQEAVTVEPGAIWGQVYDAVTTKGGRYVQGGGCMTVGVAGLIQSGGFGSFSRAYGMAAGNLLEAEIVTADGAVRIANVCMNPDLYWGIKGGGGGSLGVVTRLTLRTHSLPEFFGAVFTTIKATCSYVAEGNFFDETWRESFWGSNYTRLLAVKDKYDPDGFFFVHHGVGSERWNADGFMRLT
jgi:FAD/FMN-containing dehydrogenase